MFLRSKVIAILAVLVGLFTLSQFAIQRLVLYPSFAELEQRQARQDLQRVVEALANDVRHLDGLCHDWASWDDTYDFVVTQDPVYREGNLQETQLLNNHLTILYIVDLSGEVVARLMHEPTAGEAVLQLPELPVGHRSPSEPLHTVGAVDATAAGVFVTREGPMLVAARPILTSSDEGPVRGSLLMGRLLDADKLKVLSDQTKVSFELECLPAGEALGPALQQTVRRLAGAPEGLITILDEDTSEATGLVRDFQGQPAVIVHAYVPRDVTAEGSGALRFAILSTAGSAILTLVVVLLLLQRVVVDPLTALTHHTVAIGANGDLAARLRSKRTDEIGLLSGEIDAMMERLESSHTQLVTAARLAGMSEVATNVLHDVGNALNGVNISAEVVRKKLGSLGLADLERMSEQMRAHADDLGAFLTSDPKGSKYLSYMALLAQRHESDRNGLLAETGSLSEGLDHIKMLVRSQQDLAGNSEGVESVAPAAEMEAALRISGAGAGGEVEIVREFHAPPTMRVQRHRLLQILVNLLKNARQAIDEQRPAVKRLTLRVSTVDEGRRLRFEVGDNGTGIAPENVVAVFTRGFTTKPSGHGFGLHSSANTAQDMHGRLFLERTSLGQGSTFVLELPVDPQLVEAA